MTEESAADRQAAQQTREQEKKYADSATAVTPDTQRADPSDATDGASFSGESGKGTSTVFGEPSAAETAAHGESPASRDPDADPPASGYGEEPEEVDGRATEPDPDRTAGHPADPDAAPAATGHGEQRIITSDGSPGEQRPGS
ncbi:hypothetical protein ASE01_00645 [Nocardioides sp. Root190]|uniref:hypothetical protein n=1 Tax=Nocardioides sp. Root190 TaxID=1736488 RepID=UPI0006F6F9B2|nr:hypothetical protein [Nocardioides sp. Root190]KRB80051.1 hypothetical protein ASE01_00645 [Nocardioides sp. Root190]